MKNKYIALMLAVSGLIGCTSASDVDIMPTEPKKNTEKIDTALVLSKLHGSYYTTDGFNLLIATKQGKTRELSAKSSANTLYKFSNIGDTIIIKNDNIVRNLTMENKIKAFSNQR